MITQSDPGPEHVGSVRIRRALARRFPRTRVFYNWLRAKGGHYLRLLARVRPRRISATLRWLRDLARTLARRRCETRLTVGVEIAALWEPLTGIGWYLYRILEQLAEEEGVRLRLYGPTVVDSPDWVPAIVDLPDGPAIELVRYRVPDDLVLPPGLLIRVLRKLEPLLIAADANEVLFAPNYFLPRRFQLARGARVATVHDLGLHRVPWTLRPETLTELESKLEHAIFEAARLISVSAAVRDELAEFGYAEPARVQVVHHGPGQLAGIEPGNLPDGVSGAFALHVGTLEPRKNITTLLDSWDILSRTRADCPRLVLCGKYGWKSGDIRSAVTRAQRAGLVIHPGYVSEEQLAALYRHAAVVVFPSLYEGFGLPAVEAQWAGAPLVCSDLPVLREVAADGALYASPHSSEELAVAIGRILDDEALRLQLIENGHRRTSELSWRASAERTVAVWCQAAGRTARLPVNP